VPEIFRFLDDEDIEVFENRVLRRAFRLKRK
jgi:hypothetical protein